MPQENFAIAVRDIRSTYPPPFWIHGERWKGLAYRGIFRTHYAPRFSPLEMAKSKNGKMVYGSYRRPIEARWTAERMREGCFDEAVPIPLNARDSALLFELESNHRNPLDDGIANRRDAVTLLTLVRKIEKNVVLVFYRIAGERPDGPPGFGFLGYDVGEFGGDRGSRVFDLLFQEWAREPDEIRFVQAWRKELNENGLFSTLPAARRWERALAEQKPHPSCCRGGETLEIHELARVE